MVMGSVAAPLTGKLGVSEYTLPEPETSPRMTTVFPGAAAFNAARIVLKGARREPLPPRTAELSTYNSCEAAKLKYGCGAIVP